MNESVRMKVDATTVLRAVERRINELHERDLVESEHRLLFEVQHRLNEGMLALWSLTKHQGKSTPRHTPSDRGDDRGVQEAVQLVRKHLEQLTGLLRILGVAVREQQSQAAGQPLSSFPHGDQPAHVNLGERLLEMAEKNQQVVLGLLVQVEGLDLVAQADGVVTEGPELAGEEQDLRTAVAVEGRPDGTHDRD